LKQKAALEADICVIKQESKVAAAEVEARVLEQGEQEHELPSVYEDKHEEIHKYIQNLHVSEQQTTFISTLSNQRPNFYVFSSICSSSYKRSHMSAKCSSYLKCH